jgi:hypothetical protein
MSKSSTKRIILKVGNGRACHQSELSEERYGDLLHWTGFAGRRAVARKVDGSNPLCNAHTSSAPQRTQT